MKWFRHYSDAGEDEVLSAVIDEFGVEGYGAFWLMVEAITRQIKDDPRDFVQYSERKWRKITGISTKKYRKLLSFLEENGKILLENSEKNHKKYLKVKIPKLLEIADEYTKKRIRVEEKQESNDRTKSVKNPENISLDKIRLDKKSSSPKLKFTDNDIKLVEELDTYILDINPKHRFSGGQRKQKWANTFRLMRKEDKRDDIRAVMKTAFSDSFWSTVIQSADGFREHYNQLRAKMLGGKNEQKPQPTAPYH